MNKRFQTFERARLAADRNTRSLGSIPSSHGRRRRRVRTLAPPLLALLVPLPAAVALATTERELGAHEHGAASLDAVLFDDRVELLLESPWANLVGFEHAASSDEDRAAVDAALADLESGEALAGALPAAGGCTLDSAEIASTMGSVGDGHRDEEHHGDDEHADEDAHHDDGHAEDEEHAGAGHAEDGHADEDGHAGGEEHAGAGHAEDGHADEDGHAGGEGHADAGHGEEHDHEGPTHSELEAAWQFVCDDPAALDAIDLAGLRERFPAIETLTVQLAGPGGQSSATLGRGETRLDLGAIR